MMRRLSRRRFLGRVLVSGAALPGLVLAACGGASSAVPAVSAPVGTAAPTVNPTGTATSHAHAATTTPGASPAPTSTTAPTATASPAPAPSSVEAKIVEPSTDYRTWGYEPADLRVPIGTTVMWVNTGGAVHTVTSDDGATFDSGNIPAGQSVSLSMDTAGTFPYHCALHPDMRASITVGT